MLHFKIVYCFVGFCAVTPEFIPFFAHELQTIRRVSHNGINTLVRQCAHKFEAVAEVKLNVYHNSGCAFHSRASFSASVIYGTCAPTLANARNSSSLPLNQSMSSPLLSMP